MGNRKGFKLLNKILLL